METCRRPCATLLWQAVRVVTEDFLDGALVLDGQFSIAGLDASDLFGEPAPRPPPSLAIQSLTKRGDDRLRQALTGFLGQFARETVGFAIFDVEWHSTDVYKGTDLGRICRPHSIFVVSGAYAPLRQKRTR